MQALKYRQPWNIEITEVPDLDCLTDEDVIVNIEVCGICGTDVGIISGAYPVAVPGVTLGHETSGVVVKVGHNVHQFVPGDRVVVNPTFSCHKCRMCSTGNLNHCEMKAGTEAGVSYDGAFASQYRAKAAFLRKLDSHVSMQAATLTEPLSCAITGVDKLAITHTNIRAAVIGAGPMGMLYLWVLHKRGINAFMVEKNVSRLTFARDNLPSSGRIYDDFKKALKSEYGSELSQIDLVVDTTGMLTELVVDHLAPGGKLLNVALKDSHATLDILKIADKSLSVMGSIDSLNNSFERAYLMIRDGEVPADELVSHEYDLTDYQQAFSLVGCDIANSTLIPLEQPNCKVLLRLGHYE